MAKSVENSNISTPLVSVIMATFNEPVKFIKQSVSSILNQTYGNLELIIADDSTKESTTAALDKMAENDKRIVILRQNERMGFVHALNEGLKIAKGDFIARMDGDDVAVPERIASQLDFLHRHPRISIVGGSMNIINVNGDVVATRHYPSGGCKMSLWTMFRNPLGHPTVMFRRSVIDKGFFYDENFLKTEDLEFWLRLRNNGFHIANMDDVLLNYRVVGDLTIKRAGENFQYDYKARVKNISFKHFIFDIMSVLVAKTYCCIPNILISKAYSMENNGSKSN
jgi:glycosyltransferase EpsE